MELIKQTERYNITDILENDWNVSGSVNLEVNKTLHINISITTGLGKHIGEFNYTKQLENNTNSVNYTVTEEYKNTLISYSETLVEQVLTQLNM